MADDNNQKNKFEPNSKYFTIVIYGLLFVLGAILIYLFIGNFGKTLWLIGKVLSLLSPFIIGAFIAFLLYPLARFLNNAFFTKKLKLKKGLAKWLSILFAYLIAAGVIAILLFFVLPQIYDSITEISVQLPIWYENALEFIINFEKQHPELDAYINFDNINDRIEAALPGIIDYVSKTVTGLIPQIFSTSVAIVKGFFNFLIALMVSVYMIADHKHIFYHGNKLLYAALPKNVAKCVQNVLGESSRIFSGFIFGKALDSLIIGILCFVCMVIFKFPFAVLISVVVGFTNMIPVFGPYMGGIVGFIFIVIINPIQALFFALLILAIQQFDGLFLGPYILGDKMGLKPLWVIIAITVGGSLFGVIGMFLGVPCFAVIAYILNLTVNHFLKKKKVTIEPYSDDTDPFN